MARAPARQLNNLLKQYNADHQQILCFSEDRVAKCFCFEENLQSESVVTQ